MAALISINIVIKATIIDDINLERGSVGRLHAD